MGQYYVPVILDEENNVELSLSSHDFGSGLKLMEHSWLDNQFVAAFEGLLAQEAPRRVVWAGDYADPEKDEDGNPRTIKSDMYTSGEGDANLYVLAQEVEDYRPDVPGYGTASYTKTDPPNAFPSIIVRTQSHPFIVNWDKHEYVDKRKVPAVPYYWTKEPQAIHPLPLLTVEGNGRGGGDFHVPDGSDYLSDRSHARGNFDLIGRWARDHISVQAEPPVAGVLGHKFTEIDFDLVEMGVDKTAADKRANKPLKKFVGS